MSTIRFVEHDGTEHEVEIEAGQSLMQLAVNHGVPGIDADCGGECACGTCHVILEADWFGKAGAIRSDEQQMLEMTPECEGTSRLACQIEITDAMNGMVVRLPEFQM